MNDDSGKTKISNLFSSKMPGADGGDGEVTQDFGGSNAAGGMNPQDPGTFVGDPADAQAPFSAEFKSDLASQLSMDLSGASGVSQFLRDSARNENVRNLAMVIGVVLVLGGGAIFLLKSGDKSADVDPSSMATNSMESYDDYSADTASDDSYDDYGADSSSDADSSADNETFAADQSDDDYYDDMSVADSYSDDSYSSTTSGSGEIQLISPLDGQRRNYDETSEYALFEWSGGEGGVIKFSRSETMEPLEKKVVVASNSYAMAHPWPGVWYWQVENEAGVSEVSRFHVDAPQRRSVELMPIGGALAGSGGVVSWQGDSKVARYMVELSQSGWANPAWRLQTSSTSVALSNVSSGAYKLRVGAFSEVAGRWEYTSPVDVTVE